MDIVKKIIVFSLLLAAPLAYASHDTKEIEKLLEQKQSYAAYEYAKKHLDTHAGDPEYDLQYGLAALRAGYAREATFAFERVLISQPYNHRARLELATAFYAVGNYQAATANYIYVLRRNPPKNVQENIHRMLRAIEAHKDLGDKTKFINVKVKTGYDTNANSATEQQLVSIPSLGTISLASSARAARSAYIDNTVDGGFIIPITKRSELFSKLGVTDRRNFNNTASSFDTNTLLAMGGVVYKFNQKMSLTVPVLFSNMALSGRAFKHLTVYGAQFTDILNPRDKFNIFGDMRNDMNPANLGQDAMQYTGGVSWHHLFPVIKTKIASKLFYSRKVAKRLAFNFNGNKQYGIEARVDYDLPAIYKPFVRLDLQRRLYDSVHTLFGLVRKESAINFTAGLNWKWTGRTDLSAEYRFVKNNSNIGLFGFSRHYVQLGLNYKLL